MDFFGWEDWYTLGIEDFDSEHRNIARLQTELHDALQAATNIIGLVHIAFNSTDHGVEHQQ